MPISGWRGPLNTNAHGPHSLGGFKGRGRKHRGDHRGKSGRASFGIEAIALCMVTVPVCLLVTLVGYIAYGHVAG